MKKDKGKFKKGPPSGNSDGISILDIGDLLPDEKNARSHTSRGVGMVVDAIHEVGAARSGVIDEKGRLLAGNMTAEAMAQAGIRRVKVVESNGEEWVVVRRTGLTAKQKTRLALFDNRSSELSEWNLDVLGEFKGDDLLGGLFSDMEWGKLGFETEQASEGPEPQFDKAEELRQKYGVELGQVWELGDVVKCPKCGKLSDV